MSIQRIVIIGFGCIGQAVLPLLEHAFPQAAITVVDQTLDAARKALVDRHRLDSIEATIQPANFEAVLGPLLHPGVFLLNLAPEVCSLDLIALAQSRGALYLDTGIEPWDYEADPLSSHLSNDALRAKVLAFARGRESQPTALVAHGANPGFVSVLVKAALLQLARKAGLETAPPASRAQWAWLARQLAVRVIQVAEYDSQVIAEAPAPGEFANTWSTEGFIIECLQDAELGWGSHETHLPAGAFQPEGGSGAAIVLGRPGHQTRVRSWSPMHGPFDAYLITHNESISIAEFLTCEAPGHALYRPTAYYAYRPTQATHASMQWLDARSADRITRHRILKDEILDGVDELGVFLISEHHGAIWHGSRLSVQRARALAPYNSATSLQVASSVMAALRWMQAHPRRGVLESDALDHQPLLDDATHWWVPLVTHFSDWVPWPASSLTLGDFLVDETSMA